MAKSNKSDDKKNKKKKGHPVRNAIIFLLILSLFGGGGFGLWRYGGYEWGYKDGSETTAATESSSEQVVESTVTDTSATTTEELTTAEITTESGVIYIEVADAKIMILEKTFDDSASLKDYLMSVYKEGKEIELIDNKALKSSYDMAKAVLDDLGYKYKESTR